MTTYEGNYPLASHRGPTPPSGGQCKSCGLIFEAHLQRAPWTCPERSQITEATLMAGYTERIYSEVGRDTPAVSSDPDVAFPSTWVAAVPVLLHMLNLSQSRTARRFAEAELYRMAEIADKHLAEVV